MNDYYPPNSGSVYVPMTDAEIKEQQEYLDSVPTVEEDEAWGVLSDKMGNLE